MYELCTGQPPIKGASLLETIQLQTSEMPKPAASEYPGIKYGAAFDRLIAKAMAKDPADRFQSAEEFKAAVLNLRSAEKRVPAHKRTLYRKVLQLAGATFCIAAIAFVSLSFLQNPSPSPPRTNKIAQAPPLHQLTPTTNPETSELPSAPSATPVASSLKDQVEQLLAKDSGTIAITEKQPARLRALLAELASNPKAKSLTKLSILASKVRYADLAPLETKLHLSKLSLGKSELGSDIYKFIRSQKASLQELNIDSTNVHDDFFNQIKPLPMLKSVWANSTEISNRGLQSICTFPALTGLSLNENYLNDESFEIISRTKITTLRIRSVDAQASQLQKLAKLKTLTYLALGENRLDADAVEAVSHLTKLHTLGLESAGISDADVAKLVSLQNLRFINLSNSPVTGSCLISLAKIPTLRTVLHSQNAAFAKDALDRFHLANPECRVISLAPAERVNNKDLRKRVN